MDAAAERAPGTHRSAPKGVRTGSRLTSLDGLRGLAALIVVVHHAALSAPVLAAQYATPDPMAPAWWLTFTPIHLLWAGGEAVLLFFVLSGLVLVKPFLGEARAGRWPSYFRKRLLRLYLPVLAAVALTWLVLTLVPRTGDPSWSWWMAAHVVGADPQVLLHDALLLNGTGWHNSALWSLRLEVLFSLALPVYVVIARGLTAPLWLTMPVAVWGVYWTEAHGHHSLSYLCVFGVGALMARNTAELQMLADRISAATAASVRWAMVLMGGLLLVGAQWWPLLILDSRHLWLAPAARAAVVMGAAVLVFCFMHSPGVRAFGDLPAMQWLGRMSFAVYLVHEPLVVSVATVMPPSLRSLPVVIGGGVALSLLVAVLFHHVVEQPSQSLANWAGRPLLRRPAVAQPVDLTPAVTVTPVVPPSPRVAVDSDTSRLPVVNVDAPLGARGTRHSASLPIDPWTGVTRPRPVPRAPSSPRHRQVDLPRSVPTAAFPYDVGSRS